jgi:hypothetical protein
MTFLFALLFQLADCPPATEVVIDPNAVRYAGPFCKEDEVCVTPEDWQGGAFTPEGARYTITSVWRRPQTGGGFEQTLCGVRTHFWPKL